ncbi:hypothetical protein HaLaN_10788 [Haematococcus lacustris]|uniref:Uncharacterized protein n=1 Tax=Haematococcus lacustris TaxID=44745 RepID=A0A699Z744_HAELA|nr:hypothetical protein HaLaN_10788 [Haematococcus lacustris]
MAQATSSAWDGGSTPGPFDAASQAPDLMPTAKKPRQSASGAADTPGAQAQWEGPLPKKLVDFRKLMVDQLRQYISGQRLQAVDEVPLLPATFRRW